MRIKINKTIKIFQRQKNKIKIKKRIITKMRKKKIKSNIKKLRI